MKNLLSSLFLASALAFAAELPPEIAVSSSGTQKTDGLRTEEETKYAPGMLGFTTMSLNLFPADADYDVSTDGKTLFFSCRAQVGPKGILQRCRTKRGGENAFRDDCYEFILIPFPEEKNPAIYQFVVNNHGSYLLAGLGNAQKIREPEFQTAGIVKDGVWTFELALPLAQFGLKEWKEGHAIGLRICRNWRRLKTSEFGMQTTWHHKYVTFQTTDFVPKITLRKNAPVVRFLSLRKNGEADMKISLFNPAKESVTLNMDYSFRPSSSQSVVRNDKITLAAGETKIMTLPVAQITAGEVLTTRLKISDETGKKVYYSRDFAWQLEKKSPEEIFAAGGGDSQKLSFSFAYYPETDDIWYTIDLAALSSAEKAGDMTVEIFDAKGKKLAGESIPAGKTTRISHLWRIPALKKITQESNPSGEYSIVFTAKGIPGGVIKRNFERKVFEWEGNNLGKSDLIIPPFTPIQVSEKAGTVDTILRTHTMASTGLWKQIRADGTDILAGNGMYFEVSAGEKKYVADGSLKFTERKDTRVISISDWSAGPLSAKAVSDWDYDGTMKYTLTLQPSAEKIDSLDLVIPVKPEQSYLFHESGDGLRINAGGATPEKWGSAEGSRMSIQSSFLPYIWVGTEGPGISVFGENDKGWVVDKKKDAQEIYLKDGVRYLVLHLIQKPVELKKARTITLGFLATPVKPMPKDWRLIGFNVGSKIGSRMKIWLQYLGSSYCQGGLSHSNDLFPRDFDYSLWEEFAKIRKTKQLTPGFLAEWNAGYRNKEMAPQYAREVAYGCNIMRTAAPDSIIWYLNPRGLRVDIPEARTFLDCWCRGEFNNTREHPVAYGDFVSYDVDPVESYRDWAIWRYDKMLTMGVMDKMYWDNIYMTPNIERNLKYGAYYMDDGTFQPSVGLWNMRALIRRAAILMMERGKTPLNMIHVTNTAIAPIFSFAQLDLDWEDHMGVNPFQKRYTREYIRALSIGRQYGTRPFVIGLVDNSVQDKEALAVCHRSKTGVCATHELGNLFAEAYDFGYGQPGVKVWNYWQKDYPVKFDGETSSLLISKPGAFQMVVCNYDGAKPFTATLDLKALGLSTDLDVMNLQTKQPLEVTPDGKIKFELKQYDYIYMEGKEKVK